MEEEKDSDCEETVDSFDATAAERVLTSPVAVDTAKKTSRKRKPIVALTPEQKKFAAAVNCKLINTLELQKATRDRERKPFKQKYVAKNKRSEMAGTTQQRESQLRCALQNFLMTTSL